GGAADGRAHGAAGRDGRESGLARAGTAGDARPAELVPDPAPAAAARGYRTPHQRKVAARPDAGTNAGCSTRTATDSRCTQCAAGTTRHRPRQRTTLHGRCRARV